MIQEQQLGWNGFAESELPWEGEGEGRWDRLVGVASHDQEEEENATAEQHE